MLLLLSLLQACSDPLKPVVDSSGFKKITIRGAALGTTYQVQFPYDSFKANNPATSPSQLKVDKPEIERQIAAILERINQLMSSYQPDSQISRFNHARINRWFRVDPLTFEVLQQAQQVSANSNGAFDITVGSLVALWGFGEDGMVFEPPKPAAIKAELEKTGFNQLLLKPHKQAVLRQSELEVNVSAIAKGYAVDQIKQYLLFLGHAHFMIEVGGEIYAAGDKAQGVPWRVAVERPDQQQLPFRVLALRDVGVATSGNYRNFFDHKGRRYSHTIDPRTGEPVNHTLVSVSVIHESMALADAWATGLTVLGLEQGLKIARQQGLAAIFITRDSNSSQLTESFTLRAVPYMQAKESQSQQPESTSP